MNIGDYIHKNILLYSYPPLFFFFFSYISLPAIAGRYSVVQIRCYGIVAAISRSSRLCLLLLKFFYFLLRAHLGLDTSSRGPPLVLRYVLLSILLFCSLEKQRVWNTCSSILFHFNFRCLRLQSVLNINSGDQHPFNSCVQLYH